MEFLETDAGVTVLNDSYNANPTSMEAALVALAQLPSCRSGARRIAVLGDMRELGAHHDDAHRAVGERGGELGLDVVVGVGAGGAAIARRRRRRTESTRTPLATRTPHLHSWHRCCARAMRYWSRRVAPSG